MPPKEEDRFLFSSLAFLWPTGLYGREVDGLDHSTRFDRRPRVIEKEEDGLRSRSFVSGGRNISMEHFLYPLAFNVVLPLLFLSSVERKVPE